MLCVGIFANGTYGAGWNLTTEGVAATSGQGVTGILYSLKIGAPQLGAQFAGVLVLCTIIFGVAYTFFRMQNALMKDGIRSKPEDEIVGLDLPEMGVLAYDNLQLNELDIVGSQGVEMEFSGGPSPDPTIGR